MREKTDAEREIDNLTDAQVRLVFALALGALVFGFALGCAFVAVLVSISR